MHSELKMSSSSFKSSLRKKLKEIRDGSSIAPKDAAAILRHVEAWLSVQNFNTIGFYLPIFQEVDLVPVIGSWLETNPNKSAAIPVIEEERMFFAEWSPNIPLTKGIFNTLIPQTIKKIEPDVLLVPCLGFDHSNFRLGYGGGWYDRYLSQTYPRPYTVGIAYSKCRIDTISPEPTDIPLNKIITDEDDN